MRRHARIQGMKNASVLSVTGSGTLYVTVNVVERAALHRLKVARAATRFTVVRCV